MNFLSLFKKHQNQISCLGTAQIKRIPINACNVARSKEGCQNEKDLIQIKDNTDKNVKISQSHTHKCIPKKRFKKR